MSCIHCYSPSLHLLTLQKHRHNARIPTKLSWLFSGNSTNKHFKSQIGVLPLKVEDFPTFTLVVAKPANTTVLIQTSAVMIFFYLIANFVVPLFISKEFESEKEDENEKPNITNPVDKGKSSSKTGKRGFNSTKPK
ncbi:hypothetical protein BVRB_000610 [Beta vulgaris subsp. vulgaris]|uniref:Transmembrane protein n=1 Tax=Beta vulgaris subsp. vulgaris TaxID=3555 RepID=A0A0J8B4W2_BETVV|nr:uncharacterized protein LOC104883384 [Beta vulgaris subsp. vulgaris]KMS96254.1 hypothetical protein BVRB_000610 [Beta vulgaris subsp. vulgaris]